MQDALGGLLLFATIKALKSLSSHFGLFHVSRARDHWIHDLAVGLDEVQELFRLAMVDAHDHAHSHQNCQGLQRESRCDVKIVLHIAKVEEYGDKDLHHDRGRKQLKETHHRAK